MNDLEKSAVIAKWTRNDLEKSEVIAKWTRSDLEKSEVIAKWTRNDLEKSEAIAKWIGHADKEIGIHAKSAWQACFKTRVVDE